MRQILERELTLTNAIVVRADRVIDRGSVVVADGLIIEVNDRVYPSGRDVVDLAGRVLLPGLVDLHNDAIEREINPRPDVGFPIPYAYRQLDRKLISAGVATQFHAVSYSERPDRERKLSFANALVHEAYALNAVGGSLDHRVMFRLDIRTEGAFDDLVSCLELTPDPLVSLNDHVPGQGQYRDVSSLRSYMAREVKGAGADEQIDALLAASLDRVRQTQPLVEATFRQAAELKRRRGDSLTLVSHDDDSPDRVDFMVDLGCTIAEFPLNLETARHAHVRGMTIAMGAPNAFRGGSISGNGSALEFVAHGLVDILVADYYAPALIGAAARIFAAGLLDLPAAVRLISANPAAAAGLGDRGRIEPGLRADLAICGHIFDDGLVDAVLIGGEWRCLAAGLLSPSAVSELVRARSF